MPCSTVLTVAVLGPVEVRRSDAPLPVPAGKTTELLVRLALQAPEPVRAERLIEDLWSDQSPGVAPNTLQAKVSNLRKALGAPHLVTGGSAGYLLDVDPRQIDALEVVRLAEAGAALRKAGDAAAALQVCEQALAMFRGEVLPGGGDGDWLAPHRSRLEETRLRLTEDRIGVRVDLGDGSDLVGELEALVALHPLRESLWGLLITVLYRAGRQADALTAYRRVRRQLHEELGIEPGPELQALERAVLRQERTLRGLAAAAPAPSPLGNLPTLSGPLVGRQADLAEVAGLVASQRLVTVVGPAGVGKTRLAVEVARRAGPAAGSWLVRLDSAHGDASAWRTVGEALAVSGAATEATVLDRVRAAQLLLVLDGCEHLADTVAAMVEHLVGAAPALRVLATSQVALGVDGEAVHPLAPLRTADSVVLFTRLASQHRRTFRLDAESAPTVEAVCRSLDGLPLAIELAAARAKTLSVQEIARRLDDRFALLSDPAGRRPVRHRALRAAIAWSYDLLFPDDQRALWAVAVFADGAPLAAVEHVLAGLGVPAAAALDVISRLADRSLLDVEVGQGGAVRYRLLDSVREFSVEQLHAAGLADVARQAHASWFADAAADTARGVRGPTQAEHLSFVRVERANIDAALRWTHEHDPVLSLRMANDLGWAWAVLGFGPVAARRVRDAVAAAGIGAAGRDRAKGMLLAGWLEASGGDLDQATADIDAGMRMGDDESRSEGQLYLAFIRSQQGRGQDALDLLATCRAEFHRRGLRWEEGASWLLAAWAHIVLGDTAAGKAACDEALRLLGPVGDQWALNHADGMLGGLAQAEQRYSDAVAHLRRAAEATSRLGFAAAEAHHLANLGRAQEQGGDRPAAAASLHRAIDAGEAAGDLRTAALARVRLGRVLRSAGDRPAARGAVEVGAAWYQAAGGGDAAVLAQYLAAALDADAGEPTALVHLQAVLDAAREAHDTEVEVLALDTLAWVHAEAGHVATARDLLDTARVLSPAVAHLLSEHDRLDRDRAEALLDGG